VTWSFQLVAERYLKTTRLFDGFLRREGAACADEACLKEQAYRLGGKLIEFIVARAFGGYGMGRRYRVVVTVPIHEESIRLLEREAEVFVFNEPPRTEEELIEAVREADGLLVSLNVEPVTSRVIESAGRLRVIARHGIGYDNVAVQAATQCGIWATIAPVSSETVADMAFAHLLCLARKAHLATQCIKSGKRVSRNPFLFMGFDVWEKTLGIIGLGRIGQAVARRAKGFGMRVIYYDKVRREDAERELGVEFRNLEDLLRESDFVTLHVPLTPETYHMIGERVADDEAYSNTRQHLPRRHHRHASPCQSPQGGLDRRRRNRRFRARTPPARRPPLDARRRCKLNNDPSHIFKHCRVQSEACGHSGGGDVQSPTRRGSQIPGKP